MPFDSSDIWIAMSVEAFNVSGVLVKSPENNEA